VTFRARIALLAAAAVALAVVLASVGAYLVVRSQLRGEIDDALRARAAEIRFDPFRGGRGGPGFGFDFPPPFLGGAGGYVQLVPEEGPPVRPRGAGIPLPSAEAREVAAGRRGDFLEDSTVADQHVRMLTTQVEPGLALQVVRPLDEVDRTLDRLAVLLLLSSLGGVAVAATAGIVVARGALGPLRRLTETTEHVTRTRDLSRRIEDSRGDELGRLARSFNAMLASLEQSVTAQRRLVSDASHELRTPLTSLRTNVEVLARAEVAGNERRAILRDAEAQLDELTTLVAELVELARGEERAVEAEPVQLDELAAGAVERARRRAPGVRFRTRLEPSVVRGVPLELERAFANLLDNAAKWSPPGGAVDVVVHDGEVSVRDRGPGIAEDDLTRVFDRFYRAPAARGVPGSGLGLAIVKQIAERHGGTATAENARGGGARLRLRLHRTLTGDSQGS
jgi:two-component system sensor histidine kinase MprB